MANKKFKNFDLSSFSSDMFGDSFAVLSSAIAALSSELTAQTVLASFDVINNSYKQLFSALDISCELMTKIDTAVFDLVASRLSDLTSAFQIDLTLSETAARLSDALSYFSKYCEISETLSHVNHSFDAFSKLAAVLSNELTFEQDFVTLTDDAVETFEEFLEEADATSTTSVQSKMSIKEFALSILFPILLMLLPMMQNSYYHKLDSIDAHQHQIQNAIYQEQHIDFESRLLEEERIQTEEAIKQSEYLQQLIDLLSSPEVLEALQEASPETPSAPEEPSSVPEEPSSAPDTGTTLDSPDVPDSNE